MKHIVTFLLTLSVGICISHGTFAMQPTATTTTTASALTRECQWCDDCFVAIHANHPGCLSTLLAASADPEIKNTFGNTPLIYTITKNHIDCVQALLSWASKQVETGKWDQQQFLTFLNAQDNYGRTALYWAAFWGHTNILQTLLDAGADPGIKTKDGDTPLTTAVKENPWGYVTHLDCFRPVFEAIKRHPNSQASAVLNAIPKKEQDGLTTLCTSNELDVVLAYNLGYLCIDPAHITSQVTYVFIKAIQHNAWGIVNHILNDKILASYLGPIPLDLVTEVRNQFTGTSFLKEFESRLKKCTLSKSVFRAAVVEGILDKKWDTVELLLEFPEIGNFLTSDDQNVHDIRKFCKDKSILDLLNGYVSKPE